MAPSGNGHRRFSRPDEELRRLRALVELGRTSEAATGEDEVLGPALTAVSGALPGYAVAIALHRDGDLRIPERLIRGRIAIETATLVAAVALDRREPVERPDGEGVILALPLASAREPTGALVAGTARPPIPDAERAVLEVSASRLGAGLENLSLRGQVERLLFRGPRR